MSDPRHRLRQKAIYWARRWGLSIRIHPGLTRGCLAGLPITYLMGMYLFGYSETTAILDMIWACSISWLLLTGFAMTDRRTDTFKSSRTPLVGEER